MKRKLVIGLICCPLVLIAQQTVKVKKTIENSRRIESYTVLKSDHKIRHGHYQLILDDHILENGYYKNGLKDSLWQSYLQCGILKSDGYYKNGLKDSLWHSYNSGATLISAGMYKENQQVGNWNFYNRKGLLEQTYDFTNQKILYFLPYEEPGKEQKHSVLINNEYKVVILDRPALYIGGTEALSNDFIYKVKVPHEAYESGQSGLVVVQLSINEKGEVTDYEINKSYGYGLDEEVLRAVKTLKHWLPAIYQEKEIASKINIPFSLKIIK